MTLQEVEVICRAVTMSVSLVCSTVMVFVVLKYRNKQ